MNFRINVRTGCVMSVSKPNLHNALVGNFKSYTFQSFL